MAEDPERDDMEPHDKAHGHDGIGIRSKRTEDREAPRYTIGEVVSMTGVTKAMLHDYDKKGLLRPQRVMKGEGQEWRMYSEADIDRLGQAAVLLAYGFKIDEVKAILDDPDTDLLKTVEAKLEELRREEWRLRNLLLFAKFVDIADTGLYEGLLYGPSDIDEFANIARNSARYKETMARIAALDDETLQAMFEELDEIVNDYVLLDPDLGFAGVEGQLARFFDWWNRHVSHNDAGYLEFWAVFEDDSVIVSEVERIGGETAAASLQMSAFYACMKRLMVDAQKRIEEVATLAKSDVVMAIEKAHELVAVACEHLGVGAESASENPEEAAELALSVLSYMEGILSEEELRAYLDPEGAIGLDPADAAAAAKVLELGTSLEGDQVADLGVEGVGDAR